MEYFRIISWLFLTIIFLGCTHVWATQPLNQNARDVVAESPIGQVNANPLSFGAKGDARYKTSGDGNALISGTDDTAALTLFLSDRKKTNSTGSHFGGSSLHLGSNVFKITGAFTINDHYTTVTGEGYGTSVIHALTSGGNIDTPVITFNKGATGDAWNDLLSGGGLKELTLKTDASSRRNTGLLLDYAEYMRFSDITIEGFGLSAIKAGLWESTFSDLKLFGIGANQTAVGGVPVTGVIDFDSGVMTNPYRDASNNTLFSKITFSGCYGTHIKLDAHKNRTTNIHFNGFALETDPYAAADLGPVHELPFIYHHRAENSAITNGFATVHSTGLPHSAVFLKMVETGGSTFGFSNFQFNMSPDLGVNKRAPRRMRSFASLDGPNTILSLNNVTIWDPSDSIGYDVAGGRPALFEGTGQVTFNGLSIQTLRGKEGGLRRATNVFARSLKSTGIMTFVPITVTGADIGSTAFYKFNNGAITLFADAIPSIIDTWAVGDKIEYKTVGAGGYSGLICTQAGTSGTLAGVTGSVTSGGNTITVNDASKLLVGDWIRLSGGAAYNLIIGISGNVLTVGREPNTVTNGALTFHPPIWKGFGAIAP
ncbi:MAG: hypothetical protein JJE30_09310 [Desulfuromonadales bacterium]|nr:hypothetical protein [Desulfuromonadales bacterium]